MGEGFGVLLAVRVGATVSVGTGDGEGLDVADPVGVAVKLGVGDGVDAWIPAQKPPASAYAALLDRPASGCPIVPLSSYAPPKVPVAPPPSMVLRRRA